VYYVIIQTCWRRN